VKLSFAVLAGSTSFLFRLRIVDCQNPDCADRSLIGRWLARRSPLGTFRKCRNVELESGLRTKTDIRYRATYLHCTILNESNADDEAGQAPLAHKVDVPSALGTFRTCRDVRLASAVRCGTFHPTRRSEAWLHRQISRRRSTRLRPDRHKYENPAVAGGVFLLSHESRGHTIRGRTMPGAAMWYRFHERIAAIVFLNSQITLDCDPPTSK
jgi:hypothetical protein